MVGIRTVAVSGDALLLNDRPVFLRGFGRHEDFPVHGRGLDLPVLVKDHFLLRWTGANSFRTSHYPYSEEAMALADRQGLLVIDELPAVGLLFSDGDAAIAARLAACRSQLAALVARDKNHPSVILWSLANEPQTTPVDEGLRFLKELIDLAHALDPTRPASFAAQQGTDPFWLALGDVVAVNRYWGWYHFHGRLDEARNRLAAELDALHTRLGKPLVLTEFGADALPGAHGGPGETWTEEYQVELLRMVLDVAAARPWIVGTHVWNLADFRAPHTLGRPQGLNFKGVFTRAREPKMAAHFLRQRWAGSP
jgi:beta-glucuronidase